MLEPLAPVEIMAVLAVPVTSSSMNIIEMDAQTLINGAIALVGFFGGWVLNRITNSLDRLDEDMKKMPEKYVLKDDYRSDISDIKSMLKSIYDKLDNKVDK